VHAGIRICAAGCGFVINDERKTLSVVGHIAPTDLGGVVVATQCRAGVNQWNGSACGKPASRELKIVVFIVGDFGYDIQ
jgi:hypothetical protein